MTNPKLSDVCLMYEERRKRLFANMSSDSVAIFTAAPIANRNGDVDHEYRQDSDLYYLSGFAEPESLLLFLKTQDESRFEMVVRPRDPAREQWEGKRAGVEGAKSQYGADAAHTTEALANIFTEALSNKERVYYALGNHGETDACLIKVLSEFRKKKRSGPFGPSCVEEPGPMLHEMRLFKTDQEVAMMARAGAITAEGHNAAMRAVRPGLNERQIQGVVEGTFRMLGSERNGYPCIVAGGNNATILHYVNNDQPLMDGDLLLIDAGAEADYYTADVTRTFPVNGRFTPPQKELYELVLQAQEASIEASRPGATFDHIHDVSVRVLTEGMLRLGLLKGEVDALIADGSYKRYYCHRTGHWLGMDVHDVGDYVREGDSRTLQPGMVMTIEPGLYVGVDDEDAPARFRGIGIRIEDDVLITADEPKVLTAGCPKSVEAIETLMANNEQTFAPLADLT